MQELELNETQLRITDNVIELLKNNHEGGEVGYNTGFRYWCYQLQGQVPVNDLCFFEKHHKNCYDIAAYFISFERIHRPVLVKELVEVVGQKRQLQKKRMREYYIPQFALQPFLLFTENLKRLTTDPAIAILPSSTITDTLCMSYALAEMKRRRLSKKTLT
jgi:hypothetical protein